MPDIRTTVLLGLCLAAAVGVWFLPPIPQDLAYHDLADQRRLLGIPHFWNVITNLPFLAIGLAGLARTRLLDPRVPRPHYRAACLGVALVGLGSAWYHLAPGNESLGWDRLPISITFMAMSALLLHDRVSERLGRLMLWPLVALGILSVGWWLWTESQGAGDLRLYALVQFLPLLALPLLLLLWQARYTDNRLIWLALGAYALAKVAEALDAQIFAALGFFSGHSIKHLLAALAIWLILRSIREVPAVQPQTPHMG